MRKSILKSMLLLFSLALTSCMGGQINGAVSDPTHHNKTSQAVSESVIVNSEGQEIVTEVPIDVSVSENDTPSEEIIFTVSLSYAGKVYLPKKTENISVIWTSDYNQTFTKVIDYKTGIASISSNEGIDGEFHVHLSTDTINDAYTYNPNIYNVDNNHPNAAIELIKITTPSSWKLLGNKGGTDFYDNAFQISDEGVYCANVKKKPESDGQYGNNVNAVIFKFVPKKAGYYAIETWADIYNNNINPVIERYHGSIAFVNRDAYEVLNTGGASAKYTKNVKYGMELYDEYDKDGNLTTTQVGNLFPFAVYCTTTNLEYPIKVYFKLSYQKEYNKEKEYATIMIPTQAKQTPNGTGSFVNAWDSKGVLDGSKYKFNEADGYWHVYDSKTDTYGPIVCAKITSTIRALGEAFIGIEAHGNSALTVSNGTENYKYFIEGHFPDGQHKGYADYANADGVCYVTAELKDFLQKFSKSQFLFFDGNGICELDGIYSSEPNQWLFACGYYK